MLKRAREVRPGKSDHVGKLLDPQWPVDMLFDVPENLVQAIGRDRFGNLSIREHQCEMTDQARENRIDHQLHVGLGRKPLIDHCAPYLTSDTFDARVHHIHEPRHAPCPLSSNTVGDLVHPLWIHNQREHLDRLLRVRADLCTGPEEPSATGTDTRPYTALANHLKIKRCASERHPNQALRRVERQRPIRWREQP